MVRITEELVRKKSEHNEGIIGTLEELSLHQENVEKIEHLGNWCKNLEILYLQANLISKIENLHKLKKLKYLNLAINNIEKIENLEKCESLEKLDLTLNFIGDIKSVCSLKLNSNLKHLYLTGNPCSDFTEYRSYTIAHLPQLETLDNYEVKRSERIAAINALNKVERVIVEDQKKYETFRKLQKERLSKVDNNISDEEFWKSTSEHAPEVRIEMAKRSRKWNDIDKKSNKEKRVLNSFAKDGRPLNINQAKVDFKFIDEDPKEYVLDIGIYKYLDTNLINVDLQPIYVKVTIKEKIFQFVFPEEICIDSSSAKRSQTTGRLILHMPRVSYNSPVIKKTVEISDKKTPRRAFLEVQPQTNIVNLEILKSASNDGSDIPPLEFC